MQSYIVRVYRRNPDNMKQWEDQYQYLLRVECPKYAWMRFFCCLRNFLVHKNLIID